MIKCLKGQETFSKFTRFVCTVSNKSQGQILTSFTTSEKEMQSWNAPQIIIYCFSLECYQCIQKKNSKTLFVTAPKISNNTQSQFFVSSTKLKYLRIFDFSETFYHNTRLYYRILTDKQKNQMTRNNHIKVTSHFIIHAHKKVYVYNFFGEIKFSK